VKKADQETRGIEKGKGKGRPKKKFRTLEEEVVYLSMENEILKKLETLNGKLGKQNIYDLIKSMSGRYNIADLCSITDIFRSSYYKLLNRLNNPTDKQKKR